MPSSKYPQFTQVAVLRKIFLWLFSCFLSDLTVSSCPSVYWFKHISLLNVVSHCLSIHPSIHLSVCPFSRRPVFSTCLFCIFVCVLSLKQVYLQWGTLTTNNNEKKQCSSDILRWFYLREVGIVSRFWACLVRGRLIAASSWIRQEKKCSNKHPAG